MNCCLSIVFSAGRGNEIFGQIFFEGVEGNKNIKSPISHWRQPTMGFLGGGTDRLEAFSPHSNQSNLISSITFTKHIFPLGDQHSSILKRTVER